MNTYVAEYIPHDVLLPKVDVMVTNGGYGAVQRALSMGVPLVVAGNTEDKPEVAARVAWTGAGINLRTGTPTAGAVRAAVREVLNDRRYLRRARDARDGVRPARRRRRDRGTGRRSHQRAHHGGAAMSGCADPFGRPPVAPRTAGQVSTRQSRVVDYSCVPTLRRSLEPWLPNCSSSR